MAFIDKIVKFHTFSKSTVRDSLTLGEAVNPSGHTVVSSQVRTDDIPAFIDTFQDTKAAALTWAATNVDANARHNDILYYGGKFNMGFSNPKCLIRVAKQEVDGKLVDLPANQHTWADFTITDKSFLANAEGKNVIAIHKGVDICYVHGDNNAAVNSNQNSAFVRKADGTFLDHFVAPTDQILGGQPSLGYGLCLFKSGTTKALTEGEETGKNNYIGNTFAGLIHFMDARSETADATDNYKAAGFSVNCFEYIGDKLDTTIGNIREEIQDIVGTTMDGVVASVGTTDKAAAAGISVDSSTTTSPKIDITTATITDGIFATTAGNKAKLVTAADVESYVGTAINALSATGGAIATLTERVGEAEANASASASAAAASQTAAEGAKSEAAAAKTAAQSAQSSAQSAQSSAQAAQAASESAASNASASATAAQGSATSASQSASAASASAQSAAESEAAAVQAAADAKAAKEFVESTAKWEAGTEDTLGDFTSATASGVVTGTTVKTVADEVLTLAKSYSDSLHTTSLDYVVLGDSESLPTASADTLGKIYLVKEGNTANGESNIDAISGSYVEYMTRKVSETEYAWEKIGTTATDLSGYAKSVKINGTTYAANPGNSGALDLGTVVTALYNTLPSGVTGVTGNGLVNASSVYAGIAGGVMEIGVADASTTGKGLVQIASDVASNSSTAVTTAAAVKTYADTKVGDVEYFGEHDLISSKAEIIDGKLVISEQEVTWKNEGEGVLWNANITKVVNNEAFIGDEKYATVETNKIKDGNGMFYESSLSEYYSDLSNLTKGHIMFGACQMSQFVGDLPSLTDGFSMFYKCENLISFCGDLSSLPNGHMMFSNCSNLTTFTSDLSSLMNGKSMFSNTNLSLESIECIADTINEYEGEISITWSELPAEDERQELVDELSRIVDKGWTLETNQQLLPLFDSEKYETGQKTVQPLDLESEPQTIYYVVKK